jgi:hypothetical protein
MMPRSNRGRPGDSRRPGSGLAVAWTYFSEEADARTATGVMTREEAQRIAKAIAMVPEMRTIIRSLQDGLAEADADDAQG